MKDGPGQNRPLIARAAIARGMSAQGLFGFLA